MSVIRNGLLRLALAIGSQTNQHLRQLRRWQWYNRAELQRLRNSRLKALLVHAHGHTSYYHDTLEQAGVISPSGDCRLEAFHAVPLLTRSLLSENLEALTSDTLGSKTWSYKHSGGTTSKPVTVIQDSPYVDWARAVKLLFDEWTGYTLGQRKAVLWSSTRHWPNNGRRTPRMALTDFVKNEFWFGTRRWDEGLIREYMERFNRFRPVQLLGYASQLYEVARLINKHDLRVEAPDAVLSTADVLHESMKQELEEAFGAPVFNRYGCREAGDMACDCHEHRGLHVIEPVNYVELLRDDGTPCQPGETGHVVVTSLGNYVMPLIRYKLGDLAAWSTEPCGCGRALPLLSDIKGRERDYFVHPDGGRVRLSAKWFSGFDWINQVQYVQEAIDLVRIRVELAKPGDSLESHSEDMEPLVTAVRGLMGENCRVVCEAVDRVELERSGKRRFSICKVDG